MGKRVAFLVDMADLTTTFQGVAKSLREQGCEVVWIVESRIPERFHNLQLDGKKYYLSDFLQNDQGGTTEKDYGNYSHIMFSTYDRYVEFGRWKKDGDFFSVPAKILRFFENIHREECLDAIVYEMVSNPFAYAAYLFSKAREIPYFGLIFSILPGRFDIYKDISGNQESIEKHLKILDTKGGEGETAEELTFVYDWMKLVPTNYRTGFFKALAKMWHRIPAIVALMGSKYAKEFDVSFQTVRPIEMAKTRIARILKRSFNLRRLSRIVEAPVPGEKYFIYPLQFHPEATTSILAPHYVDENVVLKNIAFQIPPGIKLYVKEHPFAAGFKGIQYYRDIARLPNVRFIDYREKAKNLIDNSLGVITLTSSMGYEAVLSGKKVFAFGEVFYLAHPLCQKVGGYEHLREELQCATSSSGVDVPDDVLRRNFIAAYKYHTKPGMIEFDQSSPTYSRNCELIAKGIHEELVSPSW